MQLFTRSITKTASAVLLASTLLAPAAFAQDKPDPNAVALEVNGTKFTNADLTAAEQDFAPELERVPEAQRRQALIDVIVDIKLMADAAVEAGLDKSDEFKRRMEFGRQRLLRNEYFLANVADKITDDMVKARYEEEIAKIPDTEEFRARHILLKTAEEAKAVIEEVNGGADFAETAKAKSTGPSGPNGGDLGFFAAGQMVPEFQAAVEQLEVGGVSAEPVQTQFGFHVIKLEEKRARPKPTFDQVGPRVRQALTGELFQKEVEALRDKANINITEAPKSE